MTNPKTIDSSKKIRNTTMTIILLCWVLLSGCAGGIIHNQSGDITSDPPGASVVAHDYSINQGSAGCHGGGSDDHGYGTTPCSIAFKAAELTNWVIEVEKEGYINAKWYVPRDLSDISHHFVLEKDPFLLFVEKARMEMAQEQKDYLTNKTFLKALNRVLAECEKVLESPRMNAGIYATEAKAVYQEVKLDFPQYASTNLMKYVTFLVTECDKVVGNGTVESVVNIMFLLKEIRETVGL